MFILDFLHLRFSLFAILCIQITFSVFCIQSLLHLTQCFRIDRRGGRVGGLVKKCLCVCVSDSDFSKSTQPITTKLRPLSVNVL